MRKTFKLLLYILVFSSIVICIPSCDKDANDTDSIRAGQLADMITNQHDTIIRADYNYSEKYPVDIDQDGTADFEIVVDDKIGSAMTGAVYTTVIKCLTANTFLSIRETIDTIYLHILRDTIHHYVIYEQSCSRQAEEDSILGTRIYNSIEFCEEGDPISRDLSWAVDTLTLSSEGFGIPGGIEMYNGIEYYTGTSYPGSCREVPVNREVYLGVKLDISGIPKLGWIKLKRLSASSLKIMESGLQD
jgi:hypothetical protein